MSTTWEEASACPADSTPGKVAKRRRASDGGQLLTVTCNQTRCQYHLDGWVVHIRPDNTIPDKIDPHTREKQGVDVFMSNTRRDEALAALERQVAKEMAPGGEVRNY